MNFGNLRELLRRAYSPPSVVFIVSFLGIIAIAWFNFTTYRIWNFDLVWQTQVVESYSQFREPVVPIIGDDYKALGNHLSPILALVAPIYAIFPYTFTMNVVMAFCFALAAAILAHTASKYLPTRYVYFLAIGLGLSWGFLASAASGFHEYALGAPILAYALANFIKSDYLRCSIAAGFLVFVKEDVGLLLIGLGIAMALRKKQWKWLALSLWGGAWVALAIKLIIPSFSHSWEFESLISVDYDTLTTDILIKLTVVLFLILQAGVIGIRSPLLYVVIPFLGARFFTSWSSFYVIGYHYDTLTVIFASFALLDALVRYQDKKVLANIALTLPLVAAAVFLTIPTPGNTTSWLTRDYSEDQKVIDIYEKIYDLVPPGASVAAEDSSLAGFIDRGYETYFIRTIGDRVPDCLVNTGEDVIGADGKVVTTIEEISEIAGVTYDLEFDSSYLKLWCAASED